jgi:tetratricopeptide (TPR) repeat protein
VEGKFDDRGADRAYAEAFRDHGVNIDGAAAETSVGRLKGRPALALPLAAALDDWMFVRREVSEDVDWKRLVAVARAIDPDPLRDRLRATWGRPVTEVEDELRSLAKSINVRDHPPATLLYLAVTLRTAKQMDAGLRLLSEAQAAYPGDFWLTYSLSWELNDQKHYEGTTRFCTAAVSLRPNSPVTVQNLGAALAMQENWDEAIVCFRKALELDPQYTPAHRNLALTLSCKAMDLVISPDEKRRDPRRAMELMREAGELDPRSSKTQYWQNLGFVQYRVGDFRASIESLEKSCRLQEGNTGDAGQWTVLALAHTRLASQEGLLDKEREFHKAEGRRWFDQADKQIDKLWSARPGHANGQATWDFRGEGAALLGLPDPGKAAALFELGQTLRKQKMFAEAEVLLREAIRLKPGLVQAHLQLGWVLQSQGKPSEAEAAFREVVRLKPDQASGHIGLGRTLLNQKKFAEAEQALREGLPLEPTHTAAKELLEQALAGQAKDSEAEKPK